MINKFIIAIVWVTSTQVDTSVGFVNNQLINQQSALKIFVSMPQTNKEIAIHYLKKYAAKDLKGVEQLFAEDIILRDWKIRVTGKQEALRETKKNFESVESLKIDILSVYENDHTVAAELKILINGKEELYVIDVITINSEKKIASIRAYVGRGD